MLHGSKAARSVVISLMSKKKEHAKPWRERGRRGLDRGEEKRGREGENDDKREWEGGVGDWMVYCAVSVPTVSVTVGPLPLLLLAISRN